jgi:hypothetical protein
MFSSDLHSDADQPEPADDQLLEDFHSTGPHGQSFPSLTTKLCLAVLRGGDGAEKVIDSLIDSLGSTESVESFKAEGALAAIIRTCPPDIPSVPEEFRRSMPRQVPDLDRASFTPAQSLRDKEWILLKLLEVKNDQDHPSREAAVNRIIEDTSKVSDTLFSLRVAQFACSDEAQQEKAAVDIAETVETLVEVRKYGYASELMLKFAPGLLKVLSNLAQTKDNPNTGVVADAFNDWAKIAPDEAIDFLVEEKRTASLTAEGKVCLTENPEMRTAVWLLGEYFPLDYEDIPERLAERVVRGSDWNKIALAALLMMGASAQEVVVAEALKSREREAGATWAQVIPRFGAGMIPLIIQNMRQGEMNSKLYGAVLLRGFVKHISSGSSDSEIGKEFGAIEKELRGKHVSQAIKALCASGSEMLKKQALGFRRDLRRL